MYPADEESRRFLGVFDEIRQMQHRHAETLALDSEGVRLEVLLRLQEEHSRMFARLREILDRIVGRLTGVDSDGEKTAFYRRAVQELLEGERDLYMTAARQKDRLAQHLQKLRCGKRSLLRYRSVAIKNARPRFLSSKT